MMKLSCRRTTSLFFSTIFVALLCVGFWIGQITSPALFQSRGEGEEAIIFSNYREKANQNLDKSEERSREISNRRNNGIRESVRNDPKSTDVFRGCPLDWRGSVFTETDDGYESLKISAEEIHSGHFTMKTSRVEQLFRNPVIRLHPDRFMMPALIRGPNNQLIGLRESIYVAIRLNRTLVIPRFKKHRSDDDEEESIHPGHRVDFSSLCHFVSCITMQQFRLACGKKVDVVFRLRFFSRNRMSRMETRLGFLVARDGSLASVNYLPSVTGKDTTSFTSSKDDIRRTFGCKERCAIYGLPYYNMELDGNHNGKSQTKEVKTESDLSRIPDENLMSEIIRYTPQPEYIRDMAAEFIRDVIGGKSYLSVHWRYDNKDWMKRCNDTSRVTAGRLESCKQAMLVKPVDVAEAIRKKIESLEDTKFGRISTVYVASPPALASFIAQVKKELSSNEIQLFSLEDLVRNIQRFKSCDFIEKHQSDILSTTEMQICLKGSVFLRSSHSSWSNNVMLYRKINEESPMSIRQEDEDVFSLATAMSQKRMKLGL